MSRCQKIVDETEGLACGERARNVVPIAPRSMGGMKYEVSLCYKHLAEYRQHAAELRTARKTKQPQ